MDKPGIGFIGIGLMGSAMVLRLLDRGYAVTLCANRSRPRVDSCVAAGAAEVATAREVAAAADIVMLCMDTSASVESRMRGADGVLAGLRPGATVIDFGTSLPGSTRALGAETVTIAYRRAKSAMPASAYEQDLAAARGVTIRDRAMPVALKGNGAVAAAESDGVVS